MSIELRVHYKQINFDDNIQFFKGVPQMQGLKSQESKKAPVSSFFGLLAGALGSVGLIGVLYIVGFFYSWAYMNEFRAIWILGSVPQMQFLTRSISVFFLIVAALVGGFWFFHSTKSGLPRYSGVWRTLLWVLTVLCGIGWVGFHLPWFVPIIIGIILAAISAEAIAKSMYLCAKGMASQSVEPVLLFSFVLIFAIPLLSGIGEAKYDLDPKTTRLPIARLSEKKTPTGVTRVLLATADRVFLVNLNSATPSNVQVEKWDDVESIVGTYIER